MRNYKCKLCKYEWFSRIEEKPKQCPKCKRYDWDINKKDNSQGISQDKELNDRR